MVSFLINFFYHIVILMPQVFAKQCMTIAIRTKNGEAECEGVGLGKPISIDSPILPPERWSLFPALVIISHNLVNVFFKLRNA